MYRADPQHTAANFSSEGPASHIVQSWGVDWGEDISLPSSLATDDEDGLYAGRIVLEKPDEPVSSENVLELARVQDGTVDWTTSFQVGPGGTSFHLAYAEGTLCVSYSVDNRYVDGPLAGRLKLVDVASGTQVNSEERMGGGPITVTDGTALVPTFTRSAGYGYTHASEGLIAVSLDSGEREWTGPSAEWDYTEESSPFASTEPVVYNGSVYTSGRQGMVEIDLATGESSDFSDADGTRVLDRRREQMYVVQDKGIRPLSLETGTVDGARLLGDRTVEAMALGEQRLVVLTNNDVLLGYDLQRSRVDWTFSPGGQLEYGPVLANGVIYVTSGEYIHAINLYTGGSTIESPLRPFHVDHGFDSAPILHTPIIADDRMYVVTEEYNYYALTDAFAPRTDGFNFFNWGGDKCWDGACHDHDAVSREEIKRILSDLWPSSLGEEYLTGIVEFVYNELNSQAATNGHCFGMVFAAREYFRGTQTLPEGIDQTADLDRPAAPYESVGDMIDFHQSTQALDGSMTNSIHESILNGLRLLLPDRLIEEPVEREQLKKAIDDDGFAPIALGTSGRGMIHQILGYRYVEGVDRTTVYVYDPNSNATQYRRNQSAGFRLEIDHDGGITYYRKGIEEGSYDAYLAAVDVDRDISRSDFLLNLFVELVEYVLVGIRRLGSNTNTIYASVVGTAGMTSNPHPLVSNLDGWSQDRGTVAGTAEISITMPNGETVESVLPEFADPSGSHYDAYVFIPAGEDGAYEINVSGDLAGEYRVETHTAWEGAGVVRDETTVGVTGTQSATLELSVDADQGDEGGKLRVLKQATLPDSGGESTDQEQANGANGDGAGSGADDDGAGFGVGTAIGSVLGLAGLLGKRLRNPDAGIE